MSAANQEFGYNINPTAGSCLGKTHTEATKEKISHSKKGTKLSEEHKRKVSAFMTGNTYASGNKGVKKSEECRQRMTVAWKLRRLEQSVSEKTLEKMSAASKEVWERPGMRERYSAAHKGKKQTPETIAKIKAGNKGKRRTPETIARMKEAQRLRRQKQKATKPATQLEFDFGSDSLPATS